MSDDLSKKNTAAFQQVIAAIQAQVAEQAAHIQRLEAAVAALSGRLAEVQRQTNVQRAASQGAGPSVRP